MTCIAMLQGTGGACMLAAQSYFQEPACAHKCACLLLGLPLARLGFQLKSQIFGSHAPAVRNSPFCSANSQQFPVPSIFK